MPYSIKTPFVVNTNQTTTLGAVVGTTLNTTGLITADGGVIIPSNGNNNGNSLYVVNSSSDSSAYSDIAVGNNTANALHIFLNSSNRTGDGGVNTATIRNDTGILRLQSNTGGGINITSGLATFDSGLTSTAGTTTLGATTIGAINGTSASFSTTLGVTGLATFGTGGLTSTAGTTTLGTTTLGATTIGAITGTSATFSSTLNTTGLITANGGVIIPSNVNSPGSSLYLYNSNSGGSAYTSCILGNNTGNNFVMFLNSSTRTDDGGVNTATIRNDAGTLRLQSSVGTGISITSGLATFGSGLTSTAGTTTLGATTIGAITGTSATFSTTLGVTGLATFGSGGLTSTAGTTTLGATTIGAITGTSATFSSSLTANGGVSIISNVDGGGNNFYQYNANTGTNAFSNFIIGNNTGNLNIFLNGSGRTGDGGANTATIRNGVGILRLQTSGTTGISISTNGLATFDSGLTSTAGTTTLGVTTIGAVTGTSATFSTTLGVTGLATFGSGGLTSTAGTTTLGVTTIGAITGTSATFSTTLGVTGLATFGSGGLTSTVGTTTLGVTTIGAITGTSATFSTTLGVTGNASVGSLTVNSSNLVARTISTNANWPFIFSATAGLGGSFLFCSDNASTNYIEINSSKTLRVYGNIGVDSTTASTSNTTGSITTAGGLGISNTTDATSSTNGGSITTAGGLAVAKKAFIGTDLTVSGDSILRSIQTANFSSISTQGGYLQWNRTGADGELWLINTTVGSNPGIRFGKSNLSNVVTELMRISDNGVVNITSTTASTSNTTGGLTLASGLGISNTTDATSSTNGGTITSAGGLAVAKKAFIGTDLNVGGNITRNAQLVVMTINNLQAIPTTIDWDTTSSGTLANMSLAHSSGTFTYSGSNPSTFYLNIGIYLTGATAGTFVCEINVNGSVLSRHGQYAINGGSVLASTVINMSNTNTFSVYINGATGNANNSGNTFTWLRISQI
jgi:hypothetical protein